jgi:hypothetical protein
MGTIFEPGAEESYLDTDQSAQRWKCHPKTAQRRAKTLGVAPLLFGKSILYPISEILRAERGAVARYARRITVRPPQMEGKRWAHKKQRAEAVAS